MMCVNRLAAILTCLAFIVMAKFVYGWVFASLLLITALSFWLVAAVIQKNHRDRKL